MSQSESITRAATRSVCLWQSRTFCSPSPSFGCSVCLAPPINRFVWKRRISSKNIPARKHHTRLHAPVMFSAMICFKIHAPFHQDLTYSESRPATRTATRARSVILQSYVLTSALAKKKSKRKKKTYPSFDFSNLSFSGIF